MQTYNEKKFLDLMVRSTDWHLRSEAAKNCYALNLLVADENYQVRMETAKHIYSPATEERFVFASNESMDTQHIKEYAVNLLIKDTEETIRAEMVKQIASIPTFSISDDYINNEQEALMAKLANDKHEFVRVTANKILEIYNRGKE